MAIETTGVFATEEEKTELQALAQEAANTPVMTVRSDLPDFASVAWERTLKRCHEAALAHGLPEVTGFYGLAEDGEFIREI